MKVWLHGPREGQTININGTQFVDGVAYVNGFSNYLQRYYNVQDHMPAGLATKENPVEEVKEKEPVEIKFKIENVDTNLLNEFVEAKKSELQRAVQVTEQPATPSSNLSAEQILAEMATKGNWGNMRAYIKELTGTNFNNKAAAVKFIKENFK